MNLENLDDLPRMPNLQLLDLSNNSIKSRRDAKMGVGLTSSDLQSILSDINDNDDTTKSNQK